MERMESEEVQTIGAVGPYVKVTWNDAASTWKQMKINAENPSEHLTQCETLGELVAKDDKAIVLVMHGSQCDGVDIMAIPRDWCQSIEVLEKAGDALIEPTRNKLCILENSESQQELQDVTTSTNLKEK
jgi:hypothetical protein